MVKYNFFAVTQTASYYIIARIAVTAFLLTKAGVMIENIFLDLLIFGVAGGVVILACQFVLCAFLGTLKLNWMLFLRVTLLISVTLYLMANLFFILEYKNDYHILTIFLSLKYETFIVVVCFEFISKIVVRYFILFKIS